MEFMQDAKIPMPIAQESIHQPDSHVIVQRFIALLIDSVILAFIMAWSTRALGVVQTGTDTSVPGIIFSVGGEVYNTNALGSATWVIKLSLLWQFIFVFLYFSLQECFFGATIGKMIMKLRVISQYDDTTYSTLTLRDAIIRNLIRFIDSSGTYLLGAIICACSPRRRRLGDIVAKTLVVREESVPYLTMSNQKVRWGARVMITLCLVIAIGCPIFAYFWQPPIFIQNNITTQQLYPSEHITSYTLGEKSWGHDSLGQQTVNYPIKFVAEAYQPESKTQVCTSVVTLSWQWTMLSWQDVSSWDVTCHDQ
jgi:uncharacterized RDD family membrane protein YckC